MTTFIPRAATSPVIPFVWTRLSYLSATGRMNEDAKPGGRPLLLVRSVFLTHFSPWLPESDELNLTGMVLNMDRNGSQETFGHV